MGSDPFLDPFLQGCFITGTDTGCGKTEVSLALMQRLQEQGHQVLGMKPVAAGAAATATGLHNEDALRLQAQGSVQVPYERVNPYVFAPPIAPHIAAERAGVLIDPQRLTADYRWLAQRADRVVVEGAGGWRVPLGAGLDMAGLALLLDLPVLLVVGLKLGCLNQALLTAESIHASGARPAGWIGDSVDPRMLEQAANIATLEAALGCPCFGILPWLARPTTAGLAASLRLVHI